MGQNIINTTYRKVNAVFYAVEGHLIRQEKNLSEQCIFVSNEKHAKAFYIDVLKVVSFSKNLF